MWKECQVCGVSCLFVSIILTLFFSKIIIINFFCITFAIDMSCTVTENCFKPNDCQIKCLMVLHFLCSMGLHCRLRIGGCCQFENISTICWCCCISNYSCCGLWICCLLSMPDSLGLCTTVTNLLLQLGVDSQPSFSSFQSLFFSFNV